MLSEMVESMLPNENFYHFMHPEKIDNDDHIAMELNEIERLLLDKMRNGRFYI